MATSYSISKKVIEKITSVESEYCYVRTSIRGQMAIVTVGASSEHEMVEFNHKCPADGCQAMTANFAAGDVKAAIAEAGLDVKISLDGDTVTFGDLALSEVEAPAMFYGHEAVRTGAKVIYEGEARGITEEAAGLVGKDVCELFDANVRVMTATEGTIIIGTNGLMVIKERVNMPEPAVELDEEAMLEIDRAILSGAETFPKPAEEETEPEEVADAPKETESDAEVPFEGGTVVTPEAETEKPAEEKSTKTKTKKEEAKVDAVPTTKVLKLEEGERAAFLASPKSLSAALENMQAVASGAKVLIALGGEGKDFVGLQAYKEPVQAKFVAPVTKVSGAVVAVAVDLDRLTILVKSLVGIEDEVRFGVKDTRLCLTGSETNFFVPLVEPDAMLPDKVDGDGIAVALYPASLTTALRASVCAAKDKSKAAALTDLLFTITDGGEKITVYSSDSYSISAAQIKGRANGTPEDQRFTVPIVIRNIKWPEDNKVPVFFNFGEKLLAITCKADGRQYIIRYKADKFPPLETMLKSEGKTRVVLRGEEIKQRFGLLLAGGDPANEKKPVILTIDGPSVKAKLEESDVLIGTYGKTTGPALTIAVAAKLTLRNVSAFAPDENLFVSFNGEKDAFYLTNKDGSLVILQLPVRTGK